MADKPKVTFGRIKGWGEFDNGSPWVLLGDCVGHPKLGRQSEIRTSVVRRVEYDGALSVKLIETQNTIYERAE